MRVTIKLRGPGAAAVRRLLFGPRLEHGRLQPNPLAALGSLCLHACGIAILAVAGNVSPSQPVLREVTMIPLRSDKLVWYFAKDRLPKVASSEQQKTEKAKVELKRPGQVITADGPQPGKQLIWQPPPKISLEREAPSPNLLAFAPKPSRPEPYKKFVPQEHSKAVAEPLLVLPEPSPLMVVPAVPTPLPLATAIPGPSRPRPREFVPPPVKPIAAPPAIVLETAPNLPAPAQTQQPSIVVVGLDPARTSETPIPEGSLATRFSAGPDSGPGGGERTAAIVVPGLNVHGNEAGSAAVIGPVPKTAQPYHEPSAVEWARASSGKDSRRVARSMMSVALRPSARVIAPFVEARFSNRSVYTTSFEVGADASMEWVIWFAEQTVQGGQYLTIRPPVPWGRVGMGPEPSLPPGRFEVAAIIDKDGQPRSVMVLRGGDQVANETAAKLIAEWAFLPALRNGEPVTVDTLIEISFRRRP